MKKRLLILMTVTGMIILLGGLLTYGLGVHEIIPVPRPDLIVVGTSLIGILLIVSGVCDLFVKKTKEMEIEENDERNISLSNTVIIFVTNYPEFSMEGYEVRAFRYLLKQELEQKLPNYFRDALAELPRDDKVLHFSANAESFNIPYKDILYLESNQRVIYLYTVKPMQAPDRFYGKMEDLAAELEGDGFLRIQKSYLVNMAYIKKFNYDRVVLFDGKELSVSQKRYSQMKVQYLSWKNKNWGNARCAIIS